MNKTMNILVTAVGTGIGQSVIKCLKNAEHDYRIIGCDISPWAAGLYWCDRYYIIPKVREISWLYRISEIKEKEKIDIIIPCCDPEVERSAYEIAKWSIVAPYEAVDLCRNKMSTAQFLYRHDFLCPNTVGLEDAERIDFPILVKPKKGSGSWEVQVLFSQKELELFRAQSSDTSFVAQEYLIPENWSSSVVRKDVYKHGLLNQSDEYSTEVLVAADGEIMGAVTNWRTMKKGYPIHAIVDEYPEVTENAVKIVKKLREEFDYVGPCNIQSRVTREGVSVFEINPRFSGSSAVRCRAGFNGVDALVQNFVKGIKTYPKAKPLVEIRYWDELYLPIEYKEQMKCAS